MSHLSDKWLNEALPCIPHLHMSSVHHAAIVLSELKACRSLHKGTLPNAQHIHSLEQSIAYMNLQITATLADNLSVIGGVSMKMSLAVVREGASQADSSQRWDYPPQPCWASSLCHWGTTYLQSTQAKSQ